MARAFLKKTLLFVAACASFGQPEAPPPAFEVTTVKPSNPSDRGIMNHFDAERVSYTDTPLKVIIQAAYRVRDYQISGGPAWLSSDKWDVAGKLEKPIVDRSQRFEVENRMLQTLLADRFKLAVHRETREITEYKLVVAKNGPKIHEVKNGEADSKPAGIRPGPGLLDAHRMPIAQLAFWLGAQLGLPVLDGTGLAGDYDFKVEWEPDESQPNPARPSIFAAVQEQLGLRLESLKGPVEILVIDHVEKPSAD